MVRLTLRKLPQTGRTVQFRSNGKIDMRAISESSELNGQNKAKMDMVFAYVTKAISYNSSVAVNELTGSSDPK